MLPSLIQFIRIPVSENMRVISFELRAEGQANSEIGSVGEVVRGPCLLARVILLIPGLSAFSGCLQK